MMKSNLLRLLALTVLALAGCGNAAPFTDDVMIVAFGDSLTAGPGLRKEEAFPAQLEKSFHAEGYTGVRVVNMGVSGETTGQGALRLGKVLAAKPDIVILELGANDMLRSLPVNEARQNLIHIIGQLQGQGIIVILTGLTLPRAGDYETMYSELAESYDVAFYPHFLEGVLYRREYNLDDGHPNARGAALIAGSIYPLVKETVESWHKAQK